MIGGSVHDAPAPQSLHYIFELSSPRHRFLGGYSGDEQGFHIHPSKPISDSIGGKLGAVVRANMIRWAMGRE